MLLKNLNVCTSSNNFSLVSGILLHTLILEKLNYQFQNCNYKIALITLWLSYYSSRFAVKTEVLFQSLTKILKKLNY